MSDAAYITIYLIVIGDNTVLGYADPEGEKLYVEYNL